MTPIWSPKATESLARKRANARPRRVVFNCRGALSGIKSCPRNRSPRATIGAQSEAVAEGLRPLNASTRLTALFSIHPGEGRKIGLLALLYFVLGLAFSFTQTAAFALFVATYGAQQLSYAYLVTAVGTASVAYIFLRLSERLPFATLLKINLGALVIGSILLRLGLGMSGPASQWLIFALPMWFQIFLMLGNLVVWRLASRLFDVRQGKRLFGIMGTGLWIANIIGGFAAPALVGWFGTANLFWLAAASAAVNLIILQRITRDYLGDLTEAPAATPAGRPQPSTAVLRDRYIRLIFAYVFLWWIAFYFIDNIFFDGTATRFTDADQLAAFLGTFTASLSILALVITTFITAPLIGRFGLWGGLLVMPLLVTASLAALAFLGGLSLASGALLFWLAASAKFMNVAIGFGLDQPARGVLYKPLPPALTGRVLTLAEGIVQPIAIGTAGLALLYFSTYLGLGAVPLSVIFLIIAVAWIGATITLIRAYPVALTKALTKHQWGEEARTPLDHDSIALLQQHLRDPFADAALYALDALTQADPAFTAPALDILLVHPSPQVRRVAIRQMGQAGLTEGIEAAGARLADETDPAVKAATVEALAALGTPGSFAQVMAALDDRDSQIQQGALVGLLRHGGIDGVLAAGQVFNRLLTSPLPDQRIQAAQVLGEASVKHFYQPLEALLHDPDPAVRRAALKTVARVQPAQLWPLVVDACGSPETALGASRALAAGGPAALPAIESAMARADGQPRTRLIALVRACGQIQSQRALDLLQAQASHPEGEIRLHVLRALSKLRYRVAQPADIQPALRLELGHAAAVTAFIAALPDDSGLSLLHAALDRELDHARDRVLYTLSFAHDPQAILAARDSIHGGLAGQQATALELIDSQLPPASKELVMPLFDTEQPDRRLARWRGAFPQAPQPLLDRLRAMLGSHARAYTPWARACALAALVHLDAPGCLDAVHAVHTDPDPLVRDAAHWALAQLSGSDGGLAMFSTIERVMILKSASVFSQTPDDVLAEVAGLLEEVEIAAGENLFHKGDLGDSLYIIASGRMQVHDGDRLLNDLQEREVFGEMALLDPEPRMASITALQDSQLLRLAQAPFYELLAERPEISTGLIRVLTRRLRARVRDLASLDERVQALESAGLAA